MAMKLSGCCAGSFCSFNRCPGDFFVLDRSNFDVWLVCCHSGFRALFSHPVLPIHCF